MTHLEGKTPKSLPVTLEWNTKIRRPSPEIWPWKHLPFPADCSSWVSNILVSPSLLREWMISVLRLSLGLQIKTLFLFFSFVVLSKQNTNEDVKHKSKQTIMSQNGQSILKDKTRKAFLTISEILIETDNSPESRLFWVTFSFVSTLSTLFWWKLHIWHYDPEQDIPGRQ